MKLPKHNFWGAGEPDCPPDLKAPNGELHTMRCKVCGDGWRQSLDVCMAALGPPVPRYSGWLWTHVVKGGDYRMLGEAKLQTDKPLIDMAEVVVYQGADGKLWVRDAHEFQARFSRTRPDADGVADTHTDHPLRHYDKTCPACNPSGVEDKTK